MKTTNFWRTLFFSALAVTAFASCSKNDDDNNKGFSGQPSISVNGAEATSVAHDLTQGTTEAVTIVSAGPWTMTRETADATWCTPSAWNGQGGTTNVTFEVGPATSDRECTFKLAAEGQYAGIPITKYATIVVKQNAGGSTDVETNVADIRTKMAAIATEAGVAITEDLTLTAIVVSDVAAGGFAGNLNCAVVDNSTAQGAGILVRFKSAYTFPVGQVITGSIKGGTAKLNFGVLQIGDVEPSKFTAVAGAIVKVEPIVSTVADLPKYESQLVRVNEVQPVASARGGKFYQGTASYATTNFETKTGETFGISIYKTNSWATTTDVPSKSGYVCGLVSIFNGAGQVAPRNAADVAGLTEPLFGADYTKATINQIAAAGNYEVEATIVGVYQKGVMFADNAGGSNNYIMAFNNNWTTQTSNPYIDKVNYKATVKGAVKDQHGLWQFDVPEVTVGAANAFDLGTPATFDAAAIQAYAAAIKADEKAAEYKYVKLSGVLTITPATGYNTYTVAVSGLSNELVKTVTMAYGLDSYYTAAGAVSGDVVNIEGFALGFDTTKGNLNIMVTKVSKNTSTAAITITTTPAQFEATAGDAQAIAFTAANLGSNKVFAKVEGADAAQFSVPSGAITGNSVTVTSVANTTANAKSATLVVYVAASENGNVVVKDEVALSQAAQGAAGEKTMTIVMKDIPEFAAVGTGNVAATTVTVAPFTLTFDKATGSSDPKYYGTAGFESVRMYASNTLKITGATITKIVFMYADPYQGAIYNNLLTSVGAIATDSDTQQTWTGSTSEVLLNVNPEKDSANKNRQARMMSMVITYTE